MDIRCMLISNLNFFFQQSEKDVGYDSNLGLWLYAVKELCQVGYRLGNVVIRALVRIAQVPASNRSLDIFHPVRENLFKFDFHLQQLWYFRF